MGLVHLIEGRQFGIGGVKLYQLTGNAFVLADHDAKFGIEEAGFDVRVILGKNHFTDDDVFAMDNALADEHLVRLAGFFADAGHFFDGEDLDTSFHFGFLCHDGRLVKDLSAINETFGRQMAAKFLKDEK